MSGSPTILVFDEFELDRERFELRRDGMTVHLERQAFELLSYLVDACGRVVPKEELLDNVWGTRFVTESALTTQVKAIRKALGDGGDKQRHIRTVHRRGYEFVGHLMRRDPDKVLAGLDGAVSAAGVVEIGQALAPTGRVGPAALPLLPRDHLIGREQTLEEVIGRLTTHAVVSLVGPAGVGKTRLAVEVAHPISNQYADGVCFVDLVSVAPGLDIAEAVAAAAGMPAVTGVRIADTLATADMLLILDNCEHVVESAANFVTRMTARPEDPIRVLTTSREALDISGEAVVRVDPLPTRASSSRPSPAARLLLDRAPISLDTASGAVEQVARLVDGLPLALELAASQLQFMSLEDLRSQLEGHRAVLATASSRRRGWRHRSLRSAVEWSWALLDDDERDVLARLSVFPFDWTLDAAEHLCRADGRSEPVAVLRQLHAKSLIASTMRPGLSTRYRLLFGVREFVANVAPSRVTAPAALDRLAGWLAERLEEWSFADQWVSFEYLDVLLAEMVNVRTAIEHCLAAGDYETGARLVVAAAPAFRYGVGSSAGRRWVERLLAADLADPLPARVAIAGAEASFAMQDAAATYRYATLASSRAGTNDDSASVTVAALVLQCVGRILTDPDECLPLLDTAATTARAIRASRLEAVALANMGLAELSAGRDPATVLTVATAAEQLCDNDGLERYAVATLWGAAHVLAGQPSAAANHFELLARASQRMGLLHAVAIFRLLETMCLLEAGKSLELEPAIEQFLHEFRRSTGHAGRADAILALAYRAAVRGDRKTAGKLLDAIEGRDLAHHASYMFARRAAELIGRPSRVWNISSPTEPHADSSLAEVLNEHLDKNPISPRLSARVD